MKNLMIFITGLLILINSSSAFAFYETKAVSIPGWGSESDVKFHAQTYALD